MSGENDMGEPGVVEPRTEAGIDLVEDFREFMWEHAHCDLHDAVVAIEAEARAAALDAVEEAVKGLDHRTKTVSGAARGPVLRGQHESYQRVLAAIANLRSDGETR